ncbi:hypothetical protein MMC30_005724 [Trapelia coarctata]|nr:hypothetical protein [Trapelia coarctata]
MDDQNMYEGQDGQDAGAVQGPLPAPAPSKSTKRAPQKTVDQFWDVFTTKYPGKVSSILPGNVYAKSKAANEPRGVVRGRAALKSYEETKNDCIAAVEKIAKECRRVNMRYRDPHFDIEFDLKWNKNDCLEGLVYTGERFTPNSVKRVPEIFENPQFTVDDATASDVRQGDDGDCWFLSALCAISNKPGLINRVCVARDEKVGVYGFVFHRDGDWFYTIIDDKLYLNSADYEESNNEKFAWDQVFNRQDAEEEYTKAFQTGSRALAFAQCSHENETWLPLLEKAYAKAHGDYRSIDGGFTGEAIEDLSGGVTTELFTSDILDKDKFWEEELSKVNEEFLFGCATGFFDSWKGRQSHHTDRKGVVAMHAYSIMEAKEVNGLRLLKVRNPWGKTEWQGPWSDGSKEWTPEWMQILNHKFGDDGVFWISYRDLLRKYQVFDRTRLFGSEWSVTQCWTTLDVPWSADYNDTKFTITVEQKGPIVIVLSQLDDRYFLGLQGQYDYSLHFRLDKEGEEGYIVRSHGNYLMRRSVSTDLELEAGTYSVLMKITAKRNTSLPTPEETLRNTCNIKQEKLVQIGLAYDLAHARGQVNETDEEKKQREEKEEKAKAAAIKKKREGAREWKYKEWVLHKKQIERRKREKQRDEEHKRKKAEAAKAAANPDESGKDKDTPAETVEASKDDKPTTEAVELAKDEQPATEVIEVAKDEQPATEVVETTKDEKPEAVISELAAANPEPPAAAAAAAAAPAASCHPTTKADPAAEETALKDLTTQAKIDQFNKDLQAVQENNPALPAGPPTEISDTDSILSFSSSIISDLDFDPEAADPAPVEVLAGAEEVDEENEEFANDPWNAVCVVGLRVFSKVGEGKGVSIAVVRPKVGEDEETPLDLDDPSKGMTEEGATGEGGEEGQGGQVEVSGPEGEGNEGVGGEESKGESKEVIENGS